MRHFVTVMLILVAVIHLLPLVAVTGATRVSSLYGVQVTEPNLEILMRHRAVLFGIVGVLLLYGAFRVDLQVAAMLAGFVSVVSFLLLGWSVGDYNAQMSRVMAVDLLALAFLIAAGVARLLSHSEI